VALTVSVRTISDYGYYASAFLNWLASFSIGDSRILNAPALPSSFRIQLIAEWRMMIGPAAQLNELRSVEGICDALNFAYGKLKWIGNWELVGVRLWGTEGMARGAFLLQRCAASFNSPQGLFNTRSVFNFLPDHSLLVPPPAT